MGNMNYILLYFYFTSRSWLADSAMQVPRTSWQGATTFELTPDLGSALSAYRIDSQCPLCCLAFVRQINLNFICFINWSMTSRSRKTIIDLLSLFSTLASISCEVSLRRTTLPPTTFFSSSIIGISITFLVKRVNSVGEVPNI